MPKYTRRRSLYLLWWLELTVTIWGMWHPKQLGRFLPGSTFWIYTLGDKALALVAFMFGIGIAVYANTSILWIKAAIAPLIYLIGAISLRQTDYNGGAFWHLVNVTIWGIFTGFVVQSFL